MALENRSSLRLLISEFSSFESGSVCEMSLSAETAAFAAKSFEAGESDSVEGPGLGEDDLLVDKTVFVPAVFVVPPSTEDTAPADPSPEGQASVVSNPEGPASVVPSPPGPAEVDG